MSAEKKFEKLLPLLIIILGAAVRLWLFGSVPGGMNQDEAFAGYEAWSLLTTGRDTAGCAFPVYLTAWGSGMNALETYLIIPFAALFGLEPWVARLPQFIVGTLSIWVLYLTAKRLLDSRGEALFAAFLLAVCPWHVLLSRWGLESNLAPGFILLGLYFFLRGLEDSRCFLLSALFYGLSLYAYATVWPILPLMITMQLIYCAVTGRLRLDWKLLLSGALLLLLALPLLLFVAVNTGLIKEIQTPFLSIPRLLYFRSGDMSAGNIAGNLKNLLRILVTQNDGLPWNSAGTFGLLYLPSLPLALTGLAAALRRSLRPRYRPEALLLINLLGGVILGALVDANVNRVNIIFIPLILLSALGLGVLCRRCAHWLLPAAAAVYTVMFILFTAWYFTSYRQEIGVTFGEGLEQAIHAAEKHGGDVYVSGVVLYPQVLFYTEYPAEEFRETVKYRAYPAAFLEAESFGRWHFGFEGPEKDGTYILSLWDETGPFVEAGYELSRYGYYTVAVKE